MWNKSWILETLILNSAVVKLNIIFNMIDFLDAMEF